VPTALGKGDGTSLRAPPTKRPDVPGQSHRGHRIVCSEKTEKRGGGELEECKGAKKRGVFGSSEKGKRIRSSPPVGGGKKPVRKEKATGIKYVEGNSLTSSTRRWTRASGKLGGGKYRLFRIS